MADACAQFVVRAACRPFPRPSQSLLELVRDAFTEAGFLDVDRRPLKVRREPSIPSEYISTWVSYTARSLTPTIAARCRASGTVPAAFPFPSPHFRPPRLTSARGR
jgi:hypothetical protein